MQLATLKNKDLAVIRDDAVLAVGDGLSSLGLLPRGASMIDLIARYDSLEDALGEMVQKGLRGEERITFYVDFYRAKWEHVGDVFFQHVGQSGSVGGGAEYRAAQLLQSLQFARSLLTAFNRLAQVMGQQACQ